MGERGTRGGPPEGAPPPQGIQSFEASYEELEALVRRLESGALTLDESLACYERGVSALQRCYRILDTAEKRLEMLVRGADGGVALREIDLAEVRGEARPGSGAMPAISAPQHPTPQPTPAPHVVAPSPTPTPSAAPPPVAPPSAPAPRARTGGSSGEREAAPAPAKSDAPKGAGPATPSLFG